jgi:hypothetical protein
MPTPNITLTANLSSILASGSFEQNAGIIITLCGFGAYIPAVSGVGMLIDAGNPLKIKQPTSSVISQVLWGNDQITPAGTFYDIAIFDSSGQVVQRGNYQFTGSAHSVDLSTIQPNVPGGLPPAFSLYVPVAFSATPAFDAAKGNFFDITLTGNVTSSSAINFGLGQIAFFFIQQDGAGGHSFAWPANFKNPPLVDQNPNSTTTTCFVKRQDGYLYPWQGWN